MFRVIRLPHSQYYSWKRDQQCGLDDLPSCPRVSPQQLTTGEIETIKQMVTSDEYRHVPIGVLAIFAQRLKKVFASTSTWYRLIRLHGRRDQKGTVRLLPLYPLQERGCNESYVREEVQEEKFTNVLRMIQFDEEVLDWIKTALKESHDDERRFHREVVDKIQKDYQQLEQRLEAMYVD